MVTHSFRDPKRLSGNPKFEHHHNPKQIWTSSQPKANLNIITTQALKISYMRSKFEHHHNPKRLSGKNITYTSSNTKWCSSKSDMKFFSTTIFVFTNYCAFCFVNKNVHYKIRQSDCSLRKRNNSLISQLCEKWKQLF